MKETAPAQEKTNATSDIDQLVEETRGRLSSRLTIDEGPHVEFSTSRVSMSTDPSVAASTGDVASGDDVPMPASILKKPKYSNSSSGEALNNHKDAAATASSELTLLQELEDAAMEEASPTPREKQAVKQFVVERDPSQVKAQAMPQTMDPRAVEGYTPQLENNNNDIVLSSLAELMEKTGVLPDQNSDDPKVLEANLEFSVMSAQQYEEEERQQQEDDERMEQPAEVFQGRFDVFSDDDDSDASYLHHKAADGDDYWSDSEDDNVGPLTPLEPRAFIKIWEALTAWITPEAVTMIMGWQEGDNGSIMEVSHGDWAQVVDTSEIAASRCAGLMALLNMNLQRSLKELDQPIDVDRGAKHRLADLLRTFNYSRPTARLDTKLWRAMTCILLEMVLALNHSKSSEPPASAKAVGITADEYYYLTQTCYKSLAAGTM